MVSAKAGARLYTVGRGAYRGQDGRRRGKAKASAGQHQEARMGNGMFLLVMIVFGFVILIYFNRRARNYKDRHPGEKNPVDQWMTGKDDRDDDL